jgi:diacylglycerol kinase (ATP)
VSRRENAHVFQIRNIRTSCEKSKGYTTLFSLATRKCNLETAVMRAVAILGPNARASDLVPFRRADLGVSLTQSFSPEPDADAVLILGGDGTIHRHLAKLVEMRIPMLPIPGGSANDFARALGMQQLGDAVVAWQEYCQGGKNVREVDLGVITALLPCDTAGAPDGAVQVPSTAGTLDSVETAPTRNQKLETRNSTFFCNIGGAGLDANANRRVNNWPRWFRAHGGYIAAALREVASWKPLRITVSLQNESGEWHERISEPATFAVFANTPAYGDGMKIAPRARLDDGLLDVCFVRRTSKRRILTFFPTVYFGSHLRLPEVEYFQTSALRLETERSMDVYADGEYVCRTPVEVRVLGRALRVIVP